jgi:hypothetical protein
MPDLEHSNVTVEPRPDTPSLAECEAVIARGLDTFIEVGQALVTIKANKLYRDAGYGTFEDYCLKRWGIGHSHRQRLMVAAVTAEQLFPPWGKFRQRHRNARYDPSCR